MQLLPSLIDKSVIGRVNYKNEAICACIILSPNDTQFVLATNILVEEGRKSDAKGGISKGMRKGVEYERAIDRGRGGGRKQGGKRQTKEKRKGRELGKMLPPRDERHSTHIEMLQFETKLYKLSTAIVKPLYSDHLWAINL